MFKTILVPLTGAERDRAALETALLAGAPFAAHLQALHVTPAIPDLLGDAGRLSRGAAGVEARAALEDVKGHADVALAAARASYEAFCHGHALEQTDRAATRERASIRFSQAEGPWSDAVIRRARYHDLTVLAHSTGEAGEEAGAVLLESGKPTLIAAREPLPYPIRTIVIAWKDTPEAARAVTAAMPLLERAKRVVVLIGNEDDDTAVTCLDCADAVVDQLAWHGIRAESRYVVPEGRSLPDAVLDSAAEVSAELVVSGAYGRSRFRQWIFGGFTRRVLEGTSIPVLMAH